MSLDGNLHVGTSHLHTCHHVRWESLSRWHRTPIQSLCPRARECPYIHSGCTVQGLEMRWGQADGKRPSVTQPGALWAHSCGVTQ